MGTEPEQQDKIPAASGKEGMGTESIAPEQQLNELKAAKDPLLAALEASSSEALKIEPMVPLPLFFLPFLFRLLLDFLDLLVPTLSLSPLFF